MTDWAAVRARWRASQPAEPPPPPEPRNPLWEAVVDTARASNATAGAMGGDEMPDEPAATPEQTEAEWEHGWQAVAARRGARATQPGEGEGPT